MDCEKVVWLSAKQLQQIVAGESDINVLNVLKKLKEMPITLEMLKTTKIGLAIDTFRKSSVADPTSQALAKELIKEWKKLLPSGKADSVAHASKRRSSECLPRGSVDDCPPAAKQSKGDDHNSPDQLSQSSTPDDLDRDSFTPPKWSDTDDEMRLKCREVLLKALQEEEMPENSADLSDLAASIERQIHKLHPANTQKEKYSATVRSRVFNLKDKKNPQLRLNVLAGVITPSRLARMTSAEMASSEMKLLREKLEKEATDEHLMGKIIKEDGSEPLVCDECGSNKCEYQTTVQPRSPDEPMSYSITCNGCGNRWKVF